MNQLKTLGAGESIGVVSFSFPKGDRERLKEVWAKAQEVSHDWQAIMRCAVRWHTLVEMDRWREQVIHGRVATALMLLVTTQPVLMAMTIETGCTTAAIVGKLAEDMYRYKEPAVLTITTTTHGDWTWDPRRVVRRLRDKMPDSLHIFIRDVGEELWQLFPHGSIVRIPQLGDIEDITITVNQARGNK